LNKRTFEHAISETESDIESRASRRRLNQNLSHYGSSSVPHTTQVPLAPTAPHQSPLVPNLSAREALPITQGQCGHSSLLIGILATLASSDPSTPSISQPDTPTVSKLSPFTDQISQSNGPLRLSKEISDQLVQIYLERVNPRYPFLHLDTFIGWYESWKAHSYLDRASDQQGLWKDYFVTMVRNLLFLYSTTLTSDLF
jgi:hypothetical protein